MDSFISHYTSDAIPRESACTYHVPPSFVLCPFFELRTLRHLGLLYLPATALNTVTNIITTTPRTLSLVFSDCTADRWALSVGTRLADREPESHFSHWFFSNHRLRGAHDPLSIPLGSFQPCSSYEYSRIWVSSSNPRKSILASPRSIRFDVRNPYDLPVASVQRNGRASQHSRT